MQFFFSVSHKKTVRKLSVSWMEDIIFAEKAAGKKTVAFYL